jgi:predicted negative regulator of RcsB-dependent stress response
MALKDIDGAAADFTAAISVSARPEPEYFLERAAALAAATPPRWAEAIQGLDDGLKQLGSGVITLQLAALDFETRAGRLDEALGRIDRASANAARKESWHVRRGALLVQAGRPADARHAYEAALAATAALPERVRKTRAVTDLENQAKEALGKLPTNP